MLRNQKCDNRKLQGEVCIAASRYKAHHTEDVQYSISGRISTLHRTLLVPTICWYVHRWNTGDRVAQSVSSGGVRIVMRLILLYWICTTLSGGLFR